MSVSIIVDNVTKIFGKDIIIDGLSLTVKPGEFFTLLGPSGCGKTTLLRMVIGFNSIEGGQIKIDDKVINDIPTNLRNMGMVFQNYAIFPNMSVKDNVAFGLKTRKMPKEKIEPLVDEILETVKISHLKDRKPTQLSGGQQQRVALARAIVIHPQVLLMDEPLSNLDAKLRIEMRNAIKRIQQKIGITTMYVTHDQEEALAVSDRIAVMHNGKIQQIGTPKQVYQRPTNLFVSTFVGLSNVLDGNIVKEGTTVAIKVDNYILPMSNIVADAANGQAIKVSIRPEEFDIDTTCSQGLPATIKSSVFLGVSTHYFVELANGKEAEVIQNSDITDIIPNNTPITLRASTNKINIFTSDGEHTLIVQGGTTNG